MRAALVSLGVFVAGSALAILLGASWTTRINRTEGIHLVEGIDPGPAVQVAPPRQTVVAVVDGLGFFEAITMKSAARMQQMGRCFTTRTGEPSISRAMYAVLSSGVEQARTGIRNNATHTEAAVESIWEVARQSGLQVSVISEISWWAELFPRGFATYRSVPRTRNFFTDAPRTQVTLIHTLYVDEAGHAHGALSKDYADAVERTDREVSAALDALDVNEDLLVVTADHGHSALGGHGGPDPRVATVLTCFIGRGVKREPGMLEMRSTGFAPALAMLMGLKFPRHMRTEVGELSAIWKILDENVLPRPYLDDRRATLIRMHAEQEAALKKRHASTLEELERDGARWQVIRALLGMLAFAALFLVVNRRIFRERAPFATAVQVAWVLALVVVTVAIFVLRRETFDLTAPNDRDEFLRETSLMCGLVALVPVVITAWREETRDDVIKHQCVVMMLLAMGNLLHPIALGWTLGYPLPPSWLMFFPFFAAVLMWSTGSVGVLSVLVRLLVGRR